MARCLNTRSKLNELIFGPTQITEFWSWDIFETSMGEYLKKNDLQNPQNPKNAHVQAKKNQCSWTNFINICDACDLKMTPILHF